MSEMRVVGVRVELPANQPILLLRETSGDRYLPIWIGSVEATAIALEQQGVKPARPQAHALRTPGPARPRAGFVRRSVRAGGSASRSSGLCWSAPLLLAQLGEPVALASSTHQRDRRWSSRRRIRDVPGGRQAAPLISAFSSNHIRRSSSRSISVQYSSTRSGNLVPARSIRVYRPAMWWSTVGMFGHAYGVPRIPMTVVSGSTSRGVFTRPISRSFLATRTAPCASMFRTGCAAKPTSRSQFRRAGPSPQASPISLRRRPPSTSAVRPFRPARTTRPHNWSQNGLGDARGLAPGFGPGPECALGCVRRDGFAAAIADEEAGCPCGRRAAACTRCRVDLGQSSGHLQQSGARAVRARGRGIDNCHNIDYRLGRIIRRAGLSHRGRRAPAMLRSVWTPQPWSGAPGRRYQPGRHCSGR
nr:bifunctional nuclease domain-containing protein [Pseudonocardia bannensis]